MSRERSKLERLSLNGYHNRAAKLKDRRVWLLRRTPSMMTGLYLDQKVWPEAQQLSYFGKPDQEKCLVYVSWANLLHQINEQTPVPIIGPYPHDIHWPSHDPTHPLLSSYPYITYTLYLPQCPRVDSSFPEARKFTGSIGPSHGFWSPLTSYYFHVFPEISGGWSAGRIWFYSLGWEKKKVEKQLWNDLWFR